MGARSKPFSLPFMLLGMEQLGCEESSAHGP
jgi:hypothetical protein